VKLIDLQLLVTHVIAFLIVLWLLRRFAWAPVLNMLAERRAKIRGEFDAAATQRQQADALRATYEQHLQRIELESREHLQQAVAEGNAAAARIRERAQQERTQRLERATEEVRLIEDSARETLRRRTIDLALQAAEKAIQERMDEAKQRDLMERFIVELERTAQRRAAG
jgi:F-type H+-transporting ATPase subunit b